MSTRNTPRPTADGRAAVFARAGDNPYTRAMTSGQRVVSYTDGGVVAWIGTGPWGPVACAVGALDPAARLLGRLRDGGELGDVRWLHVPRATRADLAPYLRVRQLIDWEYRWYVGDPPPRHPLADRVIRLDAADAGGVTAVLDASLPDSSARPGSAHVRAWWGIRAGDRLVACAAELVAGPVAQLSAIAVAPAQRGAGLGTALTVTLTRTFLDGYGNVALGVLAGNPRARALYERLGFTAALDLSSVEIA